jgi:TRAP-type uncharacterized transport system fused permease subunit
MFSYIICRLKTSVCRRNVKYPTICKTYDEFTIFSGLRVTRSLVVCVMYIRSLFVFLPFFFWPLCCLSFDIRIMIISLWYLQTLLMYPTLRKKYKEFTVLMAFVFLMLCFVEHCLSFFLIQTYFIVQERDIWQGLKNLGPPH